jgi:site-specific DNA-methyltransferase (adenine-specific)
MPNSRAPRNRTIELSKDEEPQLRTAVKYCSSLLVDDGSQKLVCGDAIEILTSTSGVKFDLLFADPPYNLTKKFGKEKFSSRSSDDYEEWLDAWLKLCVPLLTPTGSIYICGDWRSSAAIQRAGSSVPLSDSAQPWQQSKASNKVLTGKTEPKMAWLSR